MSANLCPSPLTLCNWQQFPGKTEIINFRITNTMRDLFISKFGIKSIPFAINNMMDFYVSNPEQFNAEFDKYIMGYRNTQNLTDQLASIIVNICIPSRFDGNNSTQRNNVKVAKDLHQKFLNDVVNQSELKETFTHFDLYNAYHIIYNFLLLMAIEKLKEIKIVNA
jgi:hypothetical protein